MCIQHKLGGDIFVFMHNDFIIFNDYNQENIKYAQKGGTYAKQSIERSK